MGVDHQFVMLLTVLILSIIEISEGKAFPEKTPISRGKRVVDHGQSTYLHQLYNPLSGAEHWKSEDFYYPQIDGQPVYIPALAHSESSNEFLDKYYSSFAHPWASSTQIPDTYRSEAHQTVTSKMHNIDEDGHQGNFHVLHSTKSPLLHKDVNINPKDENLNAYYAPNFAHKAGGYPQEDKTMLKQYSTSKNDQIVHESLSKAVTNKEYTEKSSKPKYEIESIHEYELPAVNKDKHKIKAEKHEKDPELEYELEYEDDYELPVVHKTENVKSKQKGDKNTNIKNKNHKVSSKPELEYTHKYEPPVGKAEHDMNKGRHKNNTPKLESELEYDDHALPAVHKAKKDESKVKQVDKIINSKTEKNDKKNQATKIKHKKHQNIKPEKVHSKSEQENRHEYELPVVSEAKHNNRKNNPQKLEPQLEYENDYSLPEVQKTKDESKKQGDKSMSSKTEHNDGDTKNKATKIKHKQNSKNPEKFPSKSKSELEYMHEYEPPVSEPKHNMNTDKKKNPPKSQLEYDNDYALPVVYKTKKVESKLQQGDKSIIKAANKDVKTSQATKSKPKNNYKDLKHQAKRDEMEQIHIKSIMDLEEPDDMDELEEMKSSEIKFHEYKPNKKSNSHEKPIQHEAKHPKTKEKISIKPNVKEYSKTTEKSKKDSEKMTTEDLKNEYENSKDVFDNKDKFADELSTEDTLEFEETFDESTDQNLFVDEHSPNPLKPTFVDDTDNESNLEALGSGVKDDVDSLDISESTDMDDGRSLSSLNSNMWSLIFNPNANQLKLKKCLTRSNETGYCTYIQNCEVPNIATSLEQLLNNACVMDDIFIGVCCPEFPVETVKVHWEQSLSSSDKEIEDEFEHNEHDCGIRSNEAMKLKSWPWKARLVSMSNGKIFCGAVVIREDYVLTAAHCTTKIPRNQILVRLGQYSESSGDDYAVVEIKRHAQYNPKTMHNDIALLKLGRRIMRDDHTGVICPPTNNPEGEKATLLGWRGRSGAKSEDPETLEVMSNEECGAKLGMKVPNSMLCTEARNDDGRICNADSGAPLVIENDGKYEVIGILSWNRNDCHQRFPSTFSRVSSYDGWIEKHAI